MAPTYSYEDAERELNQRNSPTTTEFQVLEMAKRARVTLSEGVKESLIRVNSMKDNVAVSEQRLTGLLTSHHNLGRDVERARSDLAKDNELLLPIQESHTVLEKQHSESKHNIDRVDKVYTELNECSNRLVMIELKHA